MLLKFPQMGETVWLTLQVVEAIAYFSRPHSSEKVPDHLKTELIESKNKEKWNL